MMQNIKRAWRALTGGISAELAWPNPITVYATKGLFHDVDSRSKFFWAAEQAHQNDGPVMKVNALQIGGEIFYCPTLMKINVLGMKKKVA